jgi:hypothetical protein
MVTATIEATTVTSRRRFRPTLIWLMGFVFLVALWLGWLANSARTQRLARAEIWRAHGSVDYDSQLANLPVHTYQVKGSGWFVKPSGYKQLIFNNLGIDFVETIVAVRVRNPDEALLATFEKLHSLRVLELIISQSVGDDGLARISRLKHLERLVLYYSPITDEGLAQLSGMTQLRSLSIVMSPTIGDAGVRHLRGLTHLIRLNVGYSKITNAGLREFREMTELEDLYLVGTLIDDAGLVYLQQLPALKTVDLRATKVTKEGVAKLKQEMPKLRVTFP